MKRCAGISAVIAVIGIVSTALPVSGQTPAEFAADRRLRGRPSEQGRGIRRQGRPAVEPWVRPTRACACSSTWGARYPTSSAASSSSSRVATPAADSRRRRAASPTSLTTAIGLMAASELKIADPAMIKEAIAYLGKNAKTFEEVRMAIAGLEAVAGHSVGTTSRAGTSRSRRCATPTARSARGRARPLPPAVPARRSCGWG